MATTVKFSLLSLTFLMFIVLIQTRKHILKLTDDHRKYFTLSKFGFYKGGTLQIDVQNLQFQPPYSKQIMGFSLSRTLSDSVSPNLETYQEKCLLEDLKSLEIDDSVLVAYISFDFRKKRVNVKCNGELNSLDLRAVSETSNDHNGTRSRRDAVSDTSLLLHRRKRSVIDESVTNADDVKPVILNAVTSTAHSTCEEWNIPVHVSNSLDNPAYSVKFTIGIPNTDLQGLYTLYFHNCASYPKSTRITPLPDGVYPSFNLSVTITENNDGNYLSAGEMPLPALYFCMGVIFFISGCIWLHVIRKSGESCFKIHYLMALLVFVKSFSLFFHGINFYFIQKDGYHIEAWAVLYYITHLLKGALLFITIVLIGTGWAFIKHILSDKDKKIFMVVIPLQVLANVAEIIVTESEQGELQHTTWREVFIMVDLLCCGAILFPIVWSIRHLQQASQTDGKAAISLAKLKLFRHFYIMIVCYIYFTRIIVYLLRITVPFQWEWLDELCREIATFGFFVLTGYKFQPAANNPYFLISQEDDAELEMDAVVTEVGFMENISKVNQRSGNDDDKPTVNKRENSHEYD